MIASSVAFSPTVYAVIVTGDDPVTLEKPFASAVKLLLTSATDTRDDELEVSVEVSIVEPWKFVESVPDAVM